FLRETSMSLIQSGKDWARLRAEASGHIGAVVAALLRIHIKEIAEQLNRSRTQLDNDTFRVMLLGRFNAGKSTAANILLGNAVRPGAARERTGGLLPMSRPPSTATLNWVTYSDPPFVKVKRFDDSEPEWTVEEFLGRSVIIDNDAEHRKVFDAVKGFWLGFPF